MTGFHEVRFPDNIAYAANFEVDVPVRFDTDHMAVTVESFKLHRW